MVRTEVIEWLKSIKEKYIHGGDDFYDHQRRAAIDYAIVVLENVEQPQTNADRIRAMSDEELAEQVGKYVYCGLCPLKHRCVAGACNKTVMNWLQQPAEGE